VDFGFTLSGALAGTARVYRLPIEISPDTIARY
jgi:hypothetical protein